MIAQSKLKPSDFANFINTATDHNGKGIDWQWWATFTTGYPMSLASARRTMERYHKVMGDECGALLWCAEPFDAREGFHTHGVLKTHASFDWMREAWKIATNGRNLGQYNRIQLLPYDPSLGGAHYIAKYIGKQGVLPDWDIYTRLNDDTIGTDKGGREIKAIKDKRRSVPLIETITRDLETAPMYDAQGRQLVKVNGKIVLLQTLN